MVTIVENIETRDKFKELVNTKAPLIVKASAPWCGPCKTLKPLFDERLKKLDDNVVIYMLDVDEDDDVAAYLKINKLPTIISFVDGNKMDVITGSDDKLLAQFFKKFEGHLAF